MSNIFVGEIRMFAGNYAPAGWAFCDGGLLPISENDQLFTLIGTTYGGDGQETFAVPDLRGRVPMHFGTGPDGTTYQIGETGGVESVTLTVQQIPNHTHPLTASSSIATQPNVTNNMPAEATLFNPYINVAPAVAMASTAIGPSGGSQPHENMQPFLGLNFIIALFGVFPSPV
jgi:microcystin-dependent protein